MNLEAQYKVIKELGQGAQGAVYLIKDTLTNEKLAAKVVRPTFLLISPSMQSKIDSNLKKKFCKR
jgi:serine/threonine protein kinase